MICITMTQNWFYVDDITRAWRLRILRRRKVGIRLWRVLGILLKIIAVKMGNIAGLATLPYIAKELLRRRRLTWQVGGYAAILCCIDAESLLPMIGHCCQHESHCYARYDMVET